MNATQNEEFDLAEVVAIEDAPSASANPATEKQRAFAGSLGKQLVELAKSAPQPIPGSGVVLDTIRSAWPESMLDRKLASKYIDSMLELKKIWSNLIIEMKAQAEAEASPAPSPAEVPEGMHLFEGRIYKVQAAVHGSGRPYAKLLEENPESASGWSFVYARGAIKSLSKETRMTLEEAKSFGALYGTCVYCGRVLTSEESIEYGMGPICRGKYL